jgi:hypothetical protein
MHNGTKYNDIQHNDNQHNDSQHNDTPHNDFQHNDTPHNDSQLNDTPHNENLTNSDITKKVLLDRFQLIAMVKRIFLIFFLPIQIQQIEPGNTH